MVKTNGWTTYTTCSCRLHYVDDLIHKEDSSARENYNGERDWYYRGTKINCSSQQEFERILRLKAFW